MDNIKLIRCELTDSTKVSDDGIVYHAYGIRAIDEKENMIDKIDDVSYDIHLVSDLTNTLNRFGVCADHFRDIVFDYVYSRC